MQWANAFDWSTTEIEYRAESPINSFHWNPQLFIVPSSNLSTPIYSSNICEINQESLMNMEPSAFIKQYRDLQKSIRTLQTNLEESKKRMQDYTEKRNQVKSILKNDFCMPAAEMEPFLEKLQKHFEQKITDLDLANRQSLYDQQYIVFSKMAEILREIGKEMGPVAENNCPICFTNTISMVLVPCGHGICESCQQNRPRGITPCHICRQYVDKAIKIYL